MRSPDFLHDETFSDRGIAAGFDSQGILRRGSSPRANKNDGRNASPPNFSVAKSARSTRFNSAMMLTVS